jgi:hypothetical protein
MSWRRPVGRKTAERGDRGVVSLERAGAPQGGGLAAGDRTGVEDWRGRF